MNGTYLFISVAGIIIQITEEGRKTTGIQPVDIVMYQIIPTTELGNKMQNSSGIARSRACNSNLP